MTNLFFISLEIKVEEDTVLVILLNSDGTINRKGDGTDKKDCPFAMGIGDTETIFKQLSPGIAACAGYFGKNLDDPNKQGKTTSLEFILHTQTQSKGFKFTYGADSMGPPKPVADLIIKAMLLTDAWYDRANR